MITHEAGCSCCGTSQVYHGYNHADIAEHMRIDGWVRKTSSFVCRSCWISTLAVKAATSRIRSAGKRGVAA